MSASAVSPKQGASRGTAGVGSRGGNLGATSPGAIKKLLDKYVRVVDARAVEGTVPKVDLLKMTDAEDMRAAVLNTFCVPNM